MKNNKGQGAVIGLLFGFLLIATMAILMTPLLSFIEIGVNASVGATNGGLMVTIMNSMPVFIVLVVLIAVVALVTGRQ